MNPPTNYKLLFTKDQIALGISDIAKEITKWGQQVYKDTGKDILVLPILRGGMLFFADLVRSLDTSVEVGFLRASAYTSELNNRLRAEAVSDPLQFDVSNRAVLLVDDICDSGITLNNSKNMIMGRGASQVKTSVLIDRTIKHQDKQAGIIKPDWSIFSYGGPEWFVGYGMEDKDRYSNLPAVYILNELKNV